MAVVHQEIDAVFLGGDGIGIALGDALDDLDVGNIEFVSAGGALIGANFAFHDDARFLSQAFDGVEGFGGHGVFGNDALDLPLPSRKMGNRSLPLSRRL